MEETPANICLECGLCCDGTMFSRLPPVFDDPGSGRIRPEGGGPELVHPPGPAQPCPAHRYACSIYRERPGACHHYDCALLRRHMAGEVAHDVAMSLIVRARALRDRARAAMEAVVGVHAGIGVNDLAATFTERMMGDPFPREPVPHHDEAHEHLRALDQILDAHFHITDGEAPGSARA